MGQRISLLGAPTGVPVGLAASLLYLQSAVPPILRSHGRKSVATEGSSAVRRSALQSLSFKKIKDTDRL